MLFDNHLLKKTFLHVHYLVHIEQQSVKLHADIHVNVRTFKT